MSDCTHDAPLGDALDYFDEAGRVIDGPSEPGLPYCTRCGEMWPKRTLWHFLREPDTEAAPA